jgi:hypothetical protein
VTEATTIRVGGAERADRPTAGTAAGEGTGRRLRRRHLWLVPGIAIEIFANELGTEHGIGILALIAIALAPDVPRLFGALGRPIHDLLHQPAAATGAVVLGLAGVAAAVLPIAWLVAALVWFGHVVAGRAIGDVPRRAEDRPRA